jgi:hypothetical protein
MPSDQARSTGQSTGHPVSRRTVQLDPENQSGPHTNLVREHELGDRDTCPTRCTGRTRESLEGIPSPVQVSRTPVSGIAPPGGSPHVNLAAPDPQHSTRARPHRLLRDSLDPEQPGSSPGALPHPVRTHPRRLEHHHGRWHPVTRPSAHDRTSPPRPLIVARYRVEDSPPVLRPAPSPLASIPNPESPAASWWGYHFELAATPHRVRYPFASSRSACKQGVSYEYRADFPSGDRNSSGNWHIGQTGTRVPVQKALAAGESRGGKPHSGSSLPGMQATRSACSTQALARRQVSPPGPAHEGALLLGLSLGLRVPLSPWRSRVAMTRKHLQGEGVELPPRMPPWGLWRRDR